MIDDENSEEVDGEVSKSQRKRDADVIRAFAAQLAELSPQKLKRLPLDDVLKEAITSCPPVSTRGAYKRHIQFIGKLIRKTGNFDELQQALEQPQSRPNPHLIFCNKLIDSFTDHVDTLRLEYPRVSLQQARQLATAATKSPALPERDDESKDEQPAAVAAARKKAEKARKSLLKLLTEAAQ